MATALLASVGWFCTTLFVHDLLKRALGLPADAGYRDNHPHMMLAYLLPMVIPIPSFTVSALYTVESWWRNHREWAARLAYGTLSLALFFWCWWNLRTLLGDEPRDQFTGYGVPTAVPTDTVQAAAYASICFPLAIACACLLLAMLRRPAARDA